MKALQIAASGMAAQQTRVDVVANNLANMSTTGYQSRQAEFADLHYQSITAPGTVTSDSGTVLPTGIQLGLGVRSVSVAPTISQGPLIQSGGELDFAIEGTGYLEIVLPDGQAGYTRDGGLKLSGEGIIVTSTGYALAPEIVVPDEATSISINPNGEIYAHFAGGSEVSLLGQINLVNFTNKRGLSSIGDNLFTETIASGAPTQGIPGSGIFGTIRSGYLEGSNVDPVKEITDLIKAQRGYELNAKVIKASDDMLMAAVQSK